MRSGRWLHATVWFAGLAVAAAASSAGAAPPPVTTAQPTPGEIPPWTQPPERFAVAPFDNRSNVRAFDWLVAGAAFEVGEKTEAVLGLEPTGGPLQVGSAMIEPEPGPVAAFAAARNARYVVTGWVERPNWQLRIAMTLWKITGGTAVVAAEAQRTGDVKAYHQLLGRALAELWTRASTALDAAHAQRLERALAIDVYAVTLLGRGLGHLIRGELALAEHDLERAVFIDPKCAEAQRLVGELYLATAAATPGGDARLTARALGKFNYASDLAPDDLSALRAAAHGSAQAGKYELARELFQKLVVRRPWDLDARYELGAALWRTGDPSGAERQLEQVTAHRPDHLAARRVLVLIHAARSDTAKLVGELEAIAARAPDDLEVKADLASALGALAQWDRAAAALEAIAPARPADVALHIRIGDAHRNRGDLERALAWYARAAKLAPESSWPGFAAAQALFDAGRLADASRAYTSLQRYRDELPAAEQALGAIALAQNRPDDAAWYLRRAVAAAPRELIAWRALIAAELARKDFATAIRDAVAALPTWPRDPALHYLAGIGYAMADARAQAHQELAAAMAPASDAPSAGPREASSGAGPPPGPPAAAPDTRIASAAHAALGALDAGGSALLQFTPELVRPWGDAEAIGRALDRYAALARQIAQTRAAYQDGVLGVLGILGRGPYAPARPEPVRSCPVARVAARWAAAQRDLEAASRLGVDLEATWRFIARHDEVGATASLLPNARGQVAAARKGFRIALADVAELRAEWSRGLGPELRQVGCTDRLLAAAVADPAHYQLAEDDRPEPIPRTQPPRPRPRATFYVDNAECPDPVEVWIDGAALGQVAPGRRSALVADGGERTLCLLVPGGPQCGDRGTVRQIYLHDGWSVTMHCPK
jgi:Flp pilus assembly protein TadD